ncbi:MAG: hypothetical protein KDB16_17340 [Acidimicrobiales bacterium]|nr:hypothetical protein [Acidimicrobiales bacterium]
MRFVETSAPPSALLAREVSGGPVTWFCRPSKPALVLGSSQRDLAVDRAELDRRGAELVRRRGGGGAVWVDRTVAWFDIEIGPTDPRWNDDVGKAFLWVGDALVEVLAHFGVEATNHRGALQHSRWSQLVCFAGVGPGEVLVDGRKLVGISQRRTRHGARFMCQAHCDWRADDVVEALEMSASDRSDARRELAQVAVGLGELGLDRERFEATLRSVLTGQRADSGLATANP